MVDVEAAFEQERALRDVNVCFESEQFTVPVQEQHFAMPSAGLDTVRFFDFTPVPAATATQYVNTYEHPTISAFDGVSTLGPSSDGCPPAIIGPIQSTLDSAIHYFSAGVEPLAIQTVSVSGSQSSSRTVESYTSALSMPAPERPTDLSGPSEILPVEQFAHEISTRDRDIVQGTSQQAGTIRTNLEIEENARE